MSLVFKPKIPEAFSVPPTMTQHSHFDERREYKKDPKKGNIFKEYTYRDLKKRTQRGWSDQEVDALINLRAINISYGHCAKILKRSTASCVQVLDTKDGHGLIKTLRKELIDKVIEDTGLFVDG